MKPTPPLTADFQPVKPANPRGIRHLDTRFVFHEIRAVVKNITMTIDPGLLEEVRVMAAREGLSMSRYLARAVEQALGRDREYAAARQRFLSREPVTLRKKGQKLPTRESLHERDRLR